MVMSVLQDYQVSFTIKRIFNKDFKGIHTINDTLSAYVSDHNTNMQANLLLAEIDAVLNGTKVLGGWDTQSLYLARITLTETKIYQDLEAWQNNNNITPNCFLPTADFREIFEAWKNYIE